MIRVKIVALCLLTVVAITGCGQEPLTSDQFAGTWRIDDSTRDCLPEELRSIDMTLKLRPDSGFVAEQFPEMTFLGTYAPSSRVFGGSGEWWLGEDLPWPQGRKLALRFLTVHPDGAVRVPAAVTMIEATTEGGEPVLKFHPYDPDDAEIVYLRKK